MPNKSIPTVVLGGSGYVAAEILGLLFNHPSFRVESIISSSHGGSRVDEIFPHLAGVAEDFTFSPIESAQARLAGKRQVAVFSAMPHGETAPVFADLFSGPCAARVVDVSADFRQPEVADFKQIYGKEHAAPELLSRFHCGLPDLDGATPEQFVAHPGCFTTGITLALAPLLALGICNPEFDVSAVTGSTGAGRQLGLGTHHPNRQSSMWAYQPLVHRHTHEIHRLLAGHGPIDLAFVPHSGPFSRGIHATCFGKLKGQFSAEEIVSQVADFYNHSPFIRVSEKMPTLKEIVGTNRCHLGIAASGNRVIVTSVIDNLVKGAAGGAIQWMNRLFGLDEKEGLVNAVPGWV